MFGEIVLCYNFVMEEKKKHRMGVGALILLTIIAIICDTIGLIPGVEDIAGTIFWGIAAIYFWASGMGVFNGRRLATMLVSWIIGLIPILQWLPQLSVGIIAIFLMLRAEEKTGLPISSVAGGKITNTSSGPTRLPNKTAPLNQDGIRMPNSGLTEK